MSALEAVQAKPEHIAEAREWARRREMPFPPADMLPPTGYVVPGVAIWWLYFTNASLAYTGFLLANPDVPRPVRDRALDALVRHLLQEARDAGVRSVITTVQLPAVQRRLQKHGFVVASEGHTLMGHPFGEMKGGA